MVFKFEVKDTSVQFNAQTGFHATVLHGLLCSLKWPTVGDTDLRVSLTL